MHGSLTPLAPDPAPAARAERLKAAMRLLKQGSLDAALVQLAGLNSDFPADTAIPEIMLQRLLAAGRNDEAATLAVANIAIARNSDRLALLTLLALERGGQPAPALAMLLDYGDAFPTVELAMAALRLIKAADSSDKSRIAAAALNSGIDSPEGHAALGLMLLEQGDKAAALEHLSKASPTLRVVSTLGELLMLKGEPRLALPHLQRAVELAPGMPSLRVLLGRAFRALRRFDEAEAQFSEVVRLSPGSDHWERAAIASLSQAGKPEAADELFQASVSRRQEQLPDDFSQGLAGLWDKVDTVKIPQPRLDWAWSLRDPAAGLERGEWERRAKWGHLADQLLLDWLECRTLRAEEAMRSLAEVEEIIERMERLQRQGRGLIIAPAHLGALYAAPMLFELAGYRTKWLASAPSVPSALYRSKLISTSDQIESQVARQAMMALADGDALALAVDGAMSLSAPRIPFEGQEITYSAFAARMSHRFGSPSLFVIPQWVDGRIDFMCEDLPLTERGEPIEAFLPRWRAAWLASLRRALSCAPENLRLGGGIWRHIR